MLSTCDEVELSANQDYRLSFGQAVFQEVKALHLCSLYSLSLVASAPKDPYPSTHDLQVGGLTWQAGGNYHCPLDAASGEALERAWQQLLGGHSEKTKLLHLTYGRKLLVRSALPVCWYDVYASRGRLGGGTQCLH